VSEETEVRAADTDDAVGGARAALGRWLSALFLLLMTAGSIWLSFNPEWVLRFRGLGYGGAFVVNMIASASIFLPVPGLLLAMAMGTALNPYLLGIVSGLGSAVGELSGYAAGASGRTLILSGGKTHPARIEYYTRRYGPWAIFVIAALPIPIFDAAGVVAGAIRMPLWVFFMATAAGKIIKYIVAILLGAGAVNNLRLWLE
jgi:membrane protein YqaA with SNARE-associated domain